MEKLILKKLIVLIIVITIVMLICGCTISSGVFMEINRSSSDTSLQASYKSFDGSLTRRVSLKAGNEVTFYYEGSGLQPVVKRGKDELVQITNGLVFNVLEDANYSFTVQGNNKNGAFSLSWVVK